MKISLPCTANRSGRAAWILAAIVLLATAAAPLARSADDDSFAKAREHFQKGRIDEALDAWDELEKAQADPARIAIGRSKCLEFRGDWKEATETLVKAVAAQEGSAPLHARLAEIRLAHGDFEGAAASVEQALKLDPDHPLARLVQADLWTATGKLKEADEAYRWFVRYYNRAQPTDPDVLLLVAAGSAQYARWHSVSDIFNFVVNTLCVDALAKDRNCWQSYLVSGRLLLEKYNRGQALPELRRAITINPRSPDVMAALAEAALQDHALAEAEQFSARALEINPRHIPSLLVRADLRLEDGNVAEVRKLCEQALEANPRDERALARLATCDLLEDGVPPATELDELLENIDHIDRATIEKPSRFSRLVVELAEHNPHPGTFFAILGSKLESRKKFDQAERYYRQAIVSMPQLSAPRSDLGMLYMRVGRNGEAGKILDKAFEADPYHVRVSNMRKVLKVLEGYESIETEHFVVRVDGQADRILGRYMAEYLEEIYPELVRQFGFEPSARTQFEVFHKAKGLTGHQWFSARMVGLPWVQTIGASTGMIVALVSPTASDKPYNWARVLKHEFVHILTLQQTEFNIPHWYTEALAVSSEGYPGPEEWKQLLLERIPAGKGMNLDNINLGFIRPRNPGDWSMAYCQSYLYAKFMTEKYGADTSAKMLAAFRRNLPVERAIEEACGVDKATFEKGYAAYLKDMIDHLRALQAEPPMTLVEAEKARKARPDDPHAAARYASELLKAGNRKDARALAEATQKKNPAEPLAAVVLAQLELRGEDLAAAAALLEPVLDRKNPYPEVLRLLAGIRLKQERYDDAAALYRVGLESVPDHVPWLKGLSTALVKSKRLDELWPVLEKLVLLDADDAGARQALAQHALSEKNFAEAVRYGKLALNIDVLDVDTHRILGQAYSALGQHDRAASEWSVAVELEPDDQDLVVELARSEVAAGRKDTATKRLRTLLEKKPDFAPARKLLDTLK